MVIDLAACCETSIRFADQHETFTVIVSSVEVEAEGVVFETCLYHQVIEKWYSFWSSQSWQSHSYDTIKISMSEE